MFHAVRAVYPHLLEAPFVDAVSESLRTGNFLLAIAGDGIRSDLQSLRRLLENRGGLLASLALLEIQLYRDSAGRTLLVPSVPLTKSKQSNRTFVTLHSELRDAETCRKRPDFECHAPRQSGFLGRFYIFRPI